MNFQPHDPQRFTPHLQEEFRIARAGAEPAVLTLESVDISIDDEVQLCFSLLFHSSDPDLPQGIYTVTHAQLGPFTLEVAPVRARRGQIRHEAVFNLLRPISGDPFPG